MICCRVLYRGADYKSPDGSGDDSCRATPPRHQCARCPDKKAVESGSVLHLKVVWGVLGLDLGGYLELGASNVGHEAVQTRVRNCGAWAG